MLCQRFAETSAKNGSLHFKPTNKCHAMKTRNIEHIKITHCNTQRLKMSAIPQMQMMLNSGKTVFYK